MMQWLGKTASRLRGRAGDTPTARVSSAGTEMRRSRYAWGELPLVRVDDAHGPIVNVALPTLAELDYSRPHLMQLARTHELVNACLRIRADRLLKPRVLVERSTNGDEWEIVPRHPLLDLLRVPGDALDTSAFWRFVSMCWDAVGYVYLEPLFDHGLLSGVNPLDPAYVTEVYSPQTGILEQYEWYPGYGERVIFQPDQLIVRRRLNDIDPAPLISALSAVESDIAFAGHIRSFMLNSGIPPGIVKFKGGISKEDSDKVKEAWIAERGAGGAYQNAPAVMGEDTEWQDIGSKLSDLDNEIVRELIESRVMMPFGVPPIVLYSFFGLRHGTYSNVSQAWDSFWGTTVETLLTEWGDWLTRGLLPFYENPNDVRAGLVRARFDVSNIPAMQEDRTPNVAMQKDAFEQGTISVNERREGLGMARRDEPEADEVAAVKPPPPPPPALPAAIVAPPADEPPEDQQKATRTTREAKAVARPPKRLENDIATYLKDQYAKARRLWLAGDERGTAAILRNIDRQLDDGTRLFGIVAPDERRAYTASWQAAMTRIEQSAVIDSGDVSAAVDLLARRCNDIADTTKAEIGEIITGGMAAEQTDAEIAEAIAKLGFDRAPARAPMIAQTEMAVASVTAATDAYSASGVVSELEWITAADDVCPECQALNGTRVALGSEFPGGLMPPAHPVCRCDVLPLIASEVAA